MCAMRLRAGAALKNQVQSSIPPHATVLPHIPCGAFLSATCPPFPGQHAGYSSRPHHAPLHEQNRPRVFPIPCRTGRPAMPPCAENRFPHERNRRRAAFHAQLPVPENAFHSFFIPAFPGNTAKEHKKNKVKDEEGKSALHFRPGSNGIMIGPHENGTRIK